MNVERDTLRKEWRMVLGGAREALQLKCKALQEAFKLNVWRTTTGESAPQQAAEDSMKWPEHALVYAWAPRDGARMFFNRITVPAEYMGIPLLSSEIGLELWMNTGAAVYVNGELSYQVDYWADTQVVPIKLPKPAGDAAPYDIFVQCKQGDGFGFFPLAEIRIAAIDEWIFQLDTLNEELGFVQFLIENGDISEENIADMLHETLEAFDYAALEGNDWEGVAADMQRIRSKLAHVRQYAKVYKVHLVAHAHIDMNWLWPWSETVSLIVRDFEAMLRIMEEFPQVCFSHSQAATYRVVQEQFPDLWERLKRQVDRGTWDVTAATWVEGDLNMAGHETLIRQFIQGKSYAREQLGVDPVVCWEPDTFGHPATMPNVLEKAGIKYYYHSRGGGDVPIYWWEGAGGSRVLVYNEPSPTGYMGRIFATRIVPGVTNIARTYGLKSNMYVYGIGDHGGGATRQDVIRAMRLDESPLLPRFVFSKTVDYYRELEQSGIRFPVIRGELNPIFTGCYNSHGDIKKANRKTEHALVQAETLSSIADIYHLSQGNMPKEESGGYRAALQLREPWRTQCFNQFHDILCGCSIRSTYDEAVPASSKAEKTADFVGAGSMRQIHGGFTPQAQADPGRHEGTEIVVYNTLSWERTDAVVLKKANYPEAEHWLEGDWLEDQNGGIAEIQCTDDEIVFVARQVPAFGFAAYRYRGASGRTANQSRTGVQLSHYGNPVLDIGRYRLEVDHESGTIISLTDTEIGKNYGYPLEWTDRYPKGKLNLLEIQYEMPHGMSAWTIGPVSRTQRLLEGAEVRVLHRGPVFQSVEVLHRFNNSEIRQEIRVYRDLSRIDFPTAVQWREQGSGTQAAPMLKVLFTPHIMAAEHTSNIPFGTIKRPADGAEVPAVHWIDMSEPDARHSYGMSLLNDGKYGHSILGNTMAMTLIRSSYEPDNIGDWGSHQFTYSIYPHPGDWRQAHSDRRGWELNQPLKAVLFPAGSSDSIAGAFSALSVEELTADGWVSARGTVITAFKPSENTLRQETVKTVRLVQMHGCASRLRIRMPVHIQTAEEVNLLEDRIRTMSIGNEGSLEIGGMKEGEIRTIRLAAGS